MSHSLLLKHAMSFSTYHLIVTGQSGANRQTAAGDAGLKE